MIRRTLKTFFNATELPAQISKKYPISLPPEQVERILREYSNSQEYTNALLYSKVLEEQINAKHVVETTKKYTKVLDREQIGIALEEAESIRKNSSVY
jgi:hypothetical protein